MTTELLETIEIETAPKPEAAVIWMHGLGADGNDFAPVVPQFGLRGPPGVRFVFPHAPMMPVTINNGYVMRAWYDVSFGDLEGRSRKADEKGMRASEAAIVRLIERENRRGIKTRNIVLAGFSQGGVMALHTGLRYTERLAGIMALSAYLAAADTVSAEASGANKDVPIFLVHGTYDPVIPLPMAVASQIKLFELGYQVQWHQYPMQHSVCPEEIADISAWLMNVLNWEQGTVNGKR